MKLMDANNLIAKAKIEAQGMSEPFKDNFAILVEWLVDKTPEAIVRCKDCIHRPTGDQYKHNLEFPDSDYKCPCQCEDFWYSWMPKDDWYCANGERRTDD